MKPKNKLAVTCRPGILFTQGDKSYLILKNNTLAMQLIVATTEEPIRRLRMQYKPGSMLHTTDRPYYRLR